MKNLLFVLVIVFFTVGLTFKVSAQETATSTVGCTVLIPISLESVNAMNFGQLALQGEAAGTVTLSAAATTVAIISSNVARISGSLFSAAIFNVGGAADHGYNITSPTTIDMVAKNGEGALLGAMVMNEIDVKSKSTELGTGGTLDGTGKDKIYVGGTLNLTENQFVGDYSGSFSLSVNYN